MILPSLGKRASTRFFTIIIRRRSFETIFRGSTLDKNLIIPCCYRETSASCCFLSCQSSGTSLQMHTHCLVMLIILAGRFQLERLEAKRKSGLHVHSRRAHESLSKDLPGCASARPRSGARRALDFASGFWTLTTEITDTDGPSSTKKMRL